MKKMVSLVAIIFNLFLICSLSIQQANSNDTESSPCTVCQDGSSIPSNFANVSMVIPGFEFVRNCGMLENMLSTLDSTNPTCISIQPFGTICGCPIPANACTLCPEGSSIPEEYYTTLLENYNATFFPPGITPNCRLVQASLHSTPDDNPTCSEGRKYAANCGCDGTEDLSAPTSLPKPTTNSSDPTTNTSSYPTTNSSDLCTLCRDGGEFAYPGKNVTPFLVRNWGLLSEGIPNFPDPNSLGTVTCRNLADLLDSVFPLEKDTEQCDQVQLALGGICGCQALDRYCDFCPNDIYVPQPDKIMYQVGLYRGEGVRVPVLTCSELKLTMTQLDYINADQCFLLNNVQHTCGCNGGERYYLGADSKFKKALLAWIPRFTGILSLMGSLWIIVDILRKKNNRNSMFSQIMLGLSTFDCFSSMAWICSTAPIPKYGLGGDSNGVYGAIGNDATCATQGFFVELGLIGSVSFNVVLSIYYVLVIVKSYREFQFQRLRRWFQVMPIIMAFTYAFTGLPHYGYIILSCHVAPYPVHTTHALTLGFVLLPLGVAWCICTFNMGCIYWSVRKQSIAARKWRFPTRGTATRTTLSTLTRPSVSQSYIQQGNENDTSPSPSISNSFLNCWCKPRWFRRDNVEGNGTNNTSAQGNGRVSHGTNASTQGNGRASIDRAVAWQASFYLCSFLLTWPYYFISFLNMTSESYGFWVMLVIFTPLQGFFNWIVYMRARWGQQINKRKQRRQAERSGKGSNGIRPTPPSSNKSSIPSSQDTPIENEKRDMAYYEDIDSLDHTGHGGETIKYVSNGVEPIIKQVIAEQSGEFSCEFEEDKADIGYRRKIDSIDGPANHDSDDEEAVNHVADEIEPVIQQFIAEESGNVFSENCSIPLSTGVPTADEQVDMECCENVDSVDCPSTTNDISQMK